MNFIVHITKSYKNYKPITKLGIWAAAATIAGLILAIIFFVINSLQTAALSQKIDSLLADNPEAVEALPNENVILAFHNYQLIPYGKIPEGFNVCWDTGEIINVTHNEIVFVVPEIKAPNGILSSNVVAMPLRAGHFYRGFTINNYAYGFTLIGIDSDMVVIGMSIVRLHADTNTY